MTGISKNVEWEPCSKECTGVRVGSDGKCLAHTRDDRDRILRDLLAADRPLEFTRGVTIDPALLAAILNAARNSEGRPCLRNASFASATFQGDADFHGARFVDHADFGETSFLGDANFAEATFTGDVNFTQAKFSGEVSLESLSIEGDAFFSEATFERPARLGPMAVLGTLHVKSATFAHPFQLATATTKLILKESRFTAGGHIRVIGADIVIKDADFPVPFIISAPGEHELDERAEWFKQQLGRDVRFLRRRPRLESAKRADVAGLALTDIDLTRCRFAGAHHLDQLTIEGSDLFFRAPTWGPGRGRQVLAEECIWRHCQRASGRRWHRVCPVPNRKSPRPLAKSYPGNVASLYRQLRRGREEAKNEPGAADFYYGEMEMRRHAAPRLSAERFLLWAYWALAGYGLRASRALLTLLLVLAASTVLLAGFGLPSTRPPATATGTIKGRPPSQELHLDYRAPVARTPTTPAVAERISDRDRLWNAWWISINAAAFRTTDQQLTSTGRRIETIVRLAGPVLLALTILAIRGRVKR